MANQEHLDRLRQGVEVWNSWRKEYPDIQPDLRDAKLNNSRLSEKEIISSAVAKIVAIDLSRAILSRAIFNGTNLRKANLSGAVLYRAILMGADLSGTNLNNADLSEANLSNANLVDANLSHADFSRADLRGTNLSFASLNMVNFSHAKMGATLFGKVDLSTAEELDTVTHYGASIIGIDTIYLSKSNLPEGFLQGAGVPDTMIEYMRSLVGKPISYYTCFISHSSRNAPFAKRLYADLQSNGVRCWFAPEDLKIGDHYHQRIDESIRLYDKLILILSEQAVQSAWVEREVVAAREKEDQIGHEVLFPIRLDDAVISTPKAWAADVRRRWHIGDFTRWKEHDAYQQAFERLLRDLKAET